MLGPVALLAREERLAISGLRLVVSSSVPEGKGLGSSAAVEIAVAQATAGAFGHLLEPRRLAMLGHRAEQLVARAPCGSMDQMTATFGEEAQILALMCRPAEIVGSFALPEGVTLWGIDSGARHAVRDAPYRRARCATFMGKALLGVEADYLTALRPEDIEAEQLPERMTGAEFLRLRDGVEDEMSRVEPAVEYPVRAATLHPVEEQVRVETFLRALEEPLTRRRSRMMGDLMAASHDGYSRCGLGTPATDHIVEAVRHAGWERGLVGARVSGGGCGGTVVVLGREEAEPVVRRIAKRLGAGIAVGTSAGAPRSERALRLADDANFAVAIAQRLDHGRVGRAAGDHQVDVGDAAEPRHLDAAELAPVGEHDLARRHGEHPLLQRGLGQVDVRDASDRIDTVAAEQDRLDRDLVEDERRERDRRASAATAGASRRAPPP